jgi:hypothetical protein
MGMEVKSILSEQSDSCTECNMLALGVTSHTIARFSNDVTIKYGSTRLLILFVRAISKALSEDGPYQTILTSQ